jgi:predicted AAA+ superfamily ATPase
MKTYPRKIENLILKELDNENIILITGMRQVGKTTLMKRIFDKIKSKNKIFIDLENPINQRIFEEENYDNIIYNLQLLGYKNDKKGYLFIDEIQILPNIVKPIKYLFDKYKIKFFLTGSSSFYLKNLFPESLSGRKIIYELFPLDFEEFLIFKEKEKIFYHDFSEKSIKKSKIIYEIYKNLYDEYIEFGGFPKVVLQDEKEFKIKIIEDIFKSYYEKDIRTLSDFRDLKKLRDLILLLTSRVGSKIEITKLASEIEVSRDTIYSYLTFLEMTYFIFLISPFTKSLNGEVRGAKKIYFCDNGILNYLGRVNKGILFENSVFLNLKKYGNINYYQKYKGGEIDFILNKKIAFESKLKCNFDDIKKLQKYSKSLNIDEFYIITKEYSEFENTILAIDL